VGGGKPKQLSFDTLQAAERCNGKGKVETEGGGGGTKKGKPGGSDIVKIKKGTKNI